MKNYQVNTKEDWIPKEIMGFTEKEDIIQTLLKEEKRSSWGINGNWLSYWKMH